MFLWTMAAVASSLPLESVEYDVWVSGPLAEIRVTQTFHNPDDAAVNATYRFPLPHRAAVDGLIMRLGDATVEGRVFERDVARERFEAAQQAGQTAALTEFERFDVFEQSVSNIQPGDTVEVELSLVQPLDRVDATYGLVLPLVVAPRFSIDGAPAGTTALNPEGTPALPVRASVSAWIDGGVPLGPVTSPTHAVFSRPDGDGWRVDAVDLPLTRDFALSWQTAQNEPLVGALTDGEHVLVVFEPPQIAEYAARRPREIVFVVDTSGSMAGAYGPEMAAIRGALQDLTPADTFRVLAFSNDVRSFARVALPGTPNNTAGALRWMQTRRPGGGTRIDRALETALALPEAPDRQRYVVLVTDGLTQQEHDVFAALSAYDGPTKVHALGLGHAVHRWALDEIAYLGGGVATVRAPGTPLTLEGLDRPTVSDVRIDWKTWDVVDATPARIPDVQLGRPQRVLARVLEEGADLVVTGTVDGVPWERTIRARHVERGRGLSSAWVRERIDALGRRQIHTGESARAEGLPLALDYGVLSPWTSFLAVDSRRRQVANTTRVVPSELPDGMRLGGLQGSVDTRHTSRGSVLTKEYLQRVPSGRTYQTAVSHSAGAIAGAGRNPNMGGSAQNENTYVLDGVNISDPVSGTFSTSFNYDAIDRVDISWGGLAPEHTSRGTTVEIEPRFGTNTTELQAGVFHRMRAGTPRTARLASDGLLLAPDASGPRSRSELRGLVAGPLVRDHAWMLLGHRSALDRTVQPQNATDRESVEHAVNAALLVQPSTEWRARATALFEPRQTENVDTDPLVAPSGQSDGRAMHAVGTASLTWWARPETEAELRVGLTRSDRVRTPREPTERGRLGLWDAPSHTALGAAWDRRDRMTAGLSLQHAHYGRAEHHLKAGLAATRLQWRTAMDPVKTTAFETALGSERDIAGQGSARPIGFDTRGWQVGGYVQDRFKPAENLTFAFGTRVDAFRSWDDDGQLLAWAGASPRLFAAWDPSNDQKTKIAGGYGRYTDTGTLGLTRTADVAARFSTPAEDWESGTAVWNDTSIDRVHGTLTAPRTDEWTATLERELVRDFALGLTGSLRNASYAVASEETARHPDSDGLGVIGHRADGPDTRSLRVRTPDLLHSRTLRLDATARKVFSRRWTATGTYTWLGVRQRDAATLGSPQVGRAFGPLGAEHRFRGELFWDLPIDPWRGQIAVFGTATTGATLERRVWEETLAFGSWTGRDHDRRVDARLPAWGDLTLRYTHEIVLYRGRLVWTAEIANVLNGQTVRDVRPVPLSRDLRAASSAWQPPRTIELGLEYRL